MENESLNAVVGDDDCGEGSILDQQFIRLIIICLYLSVFFICLFGNLFAIIVICLHKSMRTDTNFFLGNLAFADLLVAIFCVLQNMIHLTAENGNWMLGEIACKLYMFILHMFPCTVIGILVCVSLEKYIAVLHPLLALKLLTPRLRGLMMFGIWCSSFVINFPYYLATEEKNFGKINVCIRHYKGLVSVEVMIIVSFVVWYLIPLLTMAFLYSRIGLVLWKSSLKPLEVRYSGKFLLATTKIIKNVADSCGDATINFEVEGLTENGNNHLNANRSTVSADEHSANTTTQPINNNLQQIEVIETRKKVATLDFKKVIRLLIAIVSSFAVLTLPYHIRLLYNTFTKEHHCNEHIVSLLQPFSFLLMFTSCSLNPILYAFLSKRFRLATRELLNCRSGTRKFTRTRTICSEVVQEPVSRSPSLQVRTALQQTQRP